MFCIACESKLDLNTQDYCPNCGELPERVMCGRCDGDFPVSLFQLHVCSPGVPAASSSGANTEAAEVSKEISEEENELLTTYFELQDSKKEIDQIRKTTLEQLLALFSQNKVLTFNGRTVGKVINMEYPALDTDMLKQQYPEVFQACLVKVRKMNYIRRQG
jgi:hypothetical protein